MNEQSETQLVRPGTQHNGSAEAIERVGFGTIETQRRETQGASLAARAQAEVQARYIVALQRPRNVEESRVRILEHCKRPRFAARAEYAKPVGGTTIKGPTIRFVETALQEFGNVLPEETITFDDDMKRVTRIAVTDLERNITYYGDTIVEKTVERKNPKAGDEVLGSRLNTYGELVYKIRATEDDFANKAASANSKKLRNLGLKILPADIVEEAMEMARRVRQDATAKDPSAARRELADAFAQLRVMPTDLDAYLGHPFDQASPAELDELRAAFMAVRDGEARWAELVDVQRQVRGEVDKVSKAAEAAGSKVQKRLDGLKAKRAAAEQAPKPEPAPATNNEPPTAAEQAAINASDAKTTK